VVNFRKLSEKAKDVVEKRGGADALKQDAQELRDVAKGPGSLKDKARGAKDALKDPGAPGSKGDEQTGAAGERPPQDPAAG